MNKKFTDKNGMVLVEVIIYTLLLSFLLSGFIQYSFIRSTSDQKLINEIYDIQN
jgi:hypothetical protein